MCLLNRFQKSKRFSIKPQSAVTYGCGREGDYKRFV